MGKFQRLFMSFMFLVCATGIAQKYELTSPDGSIVLTVSVGDNITYGLRINHETVMDNSSMVLHVDGFTPLGTKPKVIGTKRKAVNETLYPEIRVKSEKIENQYNELNLKLKGSYSLQFRAFDNGVAYRFLTSLKRQVTIVNEEANFNFSDKSTVYFPREEELFSHNERLYEHHALDSLSNEDLASLPVLVEPLSYKLLITETGLLNYPGMWLTGSEGNALTAKFAPFPLETEVDKSRWKDDRSIRVSKEADFIAKVEGKRSYPWRIIAIAKNAADLLTNQLSYQLAEPNRIEDTSWISPGKVAWDWWNANNLFGVDFEAGINTETYKHYIDFASQYGIEYIILDEGWYKLGNVLDIVPDVDVKELVAYGKSKNVGVILWVTWSSLYQKLDEALDAYSDWGVKGVKVDFMQRDDQWMVEYYEQVAEACAERKLLVDFHGSYKPSGLRRTYPNVLTREGVKGAENNKWANYITPTHNVTIPFIRMVAGPMDYTPGAMLNAHSDDFSISYNRPMGMGTRSHQIAMYVIYESPLQMLCDSPSNYQREPSSTTFISKIPAVWDETKVLKATMGQHLIMARRSGDTWYLGGMCSEKGWEGSVDLSFLESGRAYSTQMVMDGPNAEKVAIDHKIENTEMRKGESMKIQMASGGGFAAIFTPLNSN